MNYNLRVITKGYTMKNEANKVWQGKLKALKTNPDYTVSPRGLLVREQLAGWYTVPMPAYLSLPSRKVNKAFMFAEAAWIISGSNRYSALEPYMKRYKDFSDDGIFLRGAYGPKIVDQLGYVVDAIEADVDTRQAVMNIWRERPGKSKDIPCTLSFQFLVRNGELHAVVTMRSQDIVLGYTYDVFTFSMVAQAVRLLLRERGVETELGSLTVTAGSLHLYDSHFKSVDDYLLDTEEDNELNYAVARTVAFSDTYEELIEELWRAAIRYN